MIKLSILIPTIPERSWQFGILLNSIERQIKELNTNEVEVIYNDAPKGEISIGLKRDNLYKLAEGVYSVQIDDDDLVSVEYIKTVLAAISDGKDCIGYIENCVINGEHKKSLLSLSCKEWKEFKTPIECFTYHRTPFFKTPIKTELCVQTGVKDLRFGEDHDFAKRIYPLLKTETFINKEMYFYSANSLTENEHKERYGIK